MNVEDYIKHACSQHQKMLAVLLDPEELLESESICQIGSHIREHHPDEVYMEDVPRKPGANTLMKLGAVQGMILSLCAGFRLKPTFLLPTVWRRELGMFDGTRKGMTRDVLKEKAVRMANEIFGLDLVWVKPNSTKNMDDEAEAVLIGWAVVQSQNHK